jgi:hypothetical protein
LYEEYMAAFGVLLMCMFVTKKREGRKGNWEERVKYKERRGKARKWRTCFFLGFVIVSILATRLVRRKLSVAPCDFPM